MTSEHHGYLELFEKHLHEMDAVMNVLLKGHLIIEHALDNIIDMFFFHAEHIQNRNLTFSNKLAIVRALALDKNRDDTWTMIEQINSLRNAVAHKLVIDARKKKIGALKELYFKQVEKSFAEKHSDSDDKIIVAHSCGFCVGYLAEFESDLGDLRKMIDSLSEATKLGKSNV